MQRTWSCRDRCCGRALLLLLAASRLGLGSHRSLVHLHLVGLGGLVKRACVLWSHICAGNVARDDPLLLVQGDTCHVLRSQVHSWRGGLTTVRLQSRGRSGCLGAVLPEAVLCTLITVLLRRALRILSTLIGREHRGGHRLYSLSVARVCQVALLLLKQSVCVRAGD